MKIKKLDIIGFKSFKDRTVIHFDDGITGVVGPNGCGKSNIVDALMWVMGEMSAKHLRGSSMEDVIFAGAEGYAPMGMAEVSLTLENDGGPFPAQYSRYTEVMVTRRLHRSGESEYLINKEPARLRDIQEIFMDTGAGSKGFSIIAQGAIGKIVTAKPEERRVLIEEAAGITKFKVRKKESQRKLASTEQNLVRLLDIIGEQKRQLDSLERQAQRAERYRKIKRELQAKDMWLSAREYKKVNEDMKQAEADLGLSKEKEASSTMELSELETRVQTQKLRLAEVESQVQDQSRSHQELNKKAQDIEFKIRELNLSIDQARRSNEMTGSMVTQYSLRKSNLEEEKQRVQDKMLALREEAFEVETQYERLNENFQALQKEVHEADNELTEKRREMLALSSSISQVETREGVLKSKREDESLFLSEKEKSFEELKTEKEKLQSRRNKIHGQLEQEKQMHFDLTKDLESIAENIAHISQQVDLKRTETDSLKDDLNKTASRLYGLENLQSNFEGFEDGVKSVLMWQKQKVESEQKQFKPLAECVEVPAEYELAMEASLGPRLQMLLSSGADEALGAVDYLKTQKTGRSSFVSQDLSGVMASSQGEVQLTHAQKLNSEEGFCGFLKDKVSIPEAYSSQVTHILSDIVIVDSIRTALRLRPLYPEKNFVTRDGDTLSKDGVLTGGAEDSADSGVLRRRREIKELSQKREELAGKVQLSQLALKKLEEQKKGVEEQYEQAKKSSVEKEILLAELRKDFERADGELNNALSVLNREQIQIDKKRQEIQSLNESIMTLEAQLQDLISRKAEVEARVEHLSSRLAEIRLGFDDRQKEVTDFRIKSNSKKQEVEGLERQVELISNSLSDVDGQLSQMSAEAQRNSQTLSESQVAVENCQSELTQTIHDVQESERVLAQSKDNFEQELQALKSLEEEHYSKRSSVGDLKAAINEAQLKLEQLRMKDGLLVSQMEERYQIDLRSEFTRYLDPQWETQEGEDIEESVIAGQLSELKDKLRRIGEVNLSAIEEYDSLKGRYEFLSKQHEDLMGAKEHLRKVIDRINRICSKRFKETFEHVNERFQMVFPILFGGGEAKLILIESLEEEDPGIDIVAKPPGKKPQSVSLLSGGEKALTAVSLIFSIFLVKPSPFCLLDEVDAPLDDANVYRFNDLVKEMAKRSQIIVVTHNKHTMKVNNKLYGVTMQEKGVSKMVSVSLEDAAKLAEA